MQVGIVIVGFRNAADIEKCLAALENSTYREFQIIICENGGDAAHSLLKNILPSKLTGGQDVQLLKASNNGGYASGINLAISQSAAPDAWWILNPDTEPAPNALAALVGRLTQGYDAVGGPIYFPSGEVQSYAGVWLAWQAKAVSLGFGQSVGPAPTSHDLEVGQNFLSGASMFVSRRFLDTVGLMDERYFLYCEEVDWFLRAERLGMRLGFTMGGAVIHHQGTTTGYGRSLRTRSCRAVYLDERNKMLLTRKFFPLRLPVAAFLAFARLVVRYGRQGAFRQIGYGAVGWLAGLCGQSGIPDWPRD